jgi:hypothetical protein
MGFSDARRRAGGRGGFQRRVGVGVFWMLAWGVMQACAHVSDTSLLRVELGANGVAVSLNADLLVLQRVLQVDADGDQRITRQEWEQAAPRAEQWARAGVALCLAGQNAEWGPRFLGRWETEALEVPAADWQSVHVTLRLEGREAWQGRRVSLSARSLLDLLGEGHRLIVSVVCGEDFQQAVLTREFPGLEYDPPAQAGADSASGGVRWEMVRLGVEHILGGGDHLLFLCALLVMVPGWRGMLVLVSAFTVAHTLTLSLCALEWVRFPERWVEIAVAASIGWVAAGNFWRSGGERWQSAFGFGLLHGAGFASGLRQMGLPQEGFLGSLLCFNLGVELGQLGVMAPVLPLLLWLRRSRWSSGYRWLGYGISGGAIMLALVWVVDRMLR